MSTTEADVRVFLLDHLDGRLRDAGLDPGNLSDETDLFGGGVIDSLGVKVVPIYGGQPI